MPKNSIAQRLRKLSEAAERDDDVPRYVSHALYSMYKDLTHDNVTPYTGIMVERIKNASDHIRNGARLK